MIRRVLVLVEGQTEEDFVKQVLNPELGERNIWFLPTCICTRLVDGRRQFRGGHGARYQLIRRDILRLLGDSGAAAVTTMLDLYALPADFPGKDTAPDEGCFERAAYLERSWGEDIDDHRFIPNLVVHEYEGLLFSSPESIDSVFLGEDKLTELTRIAESFDTPEEINDSEQTAPSRRLKDIFPAYQKRLHGIQIAKRATLARMRRKCAHFNTWLDTIEALQGT